MRIPVPTDGDQDLRNPSTVVHKTGEQTRSKSGERSIKSACARKLLVTSIHNEVTIVITSRNNSLLLLQDVYGGLGVCAENRPVHVSLCIAADGHGPEPVHLLRHLEVVEFAVAPAASKPVSTIRKVGIQCE